MAALPIMWAVPPYALFFLDLARPGDDALPNSRVGLHERNDYEMFHQLTQRAQHAARCTAGFILARLAITCKGAAASDRALR
jgi:hypothetical protein